MERTGLGQLMFDKPSETPGLDAADDDSRPGAAQQGPYPATDMLPLSQLVTSDTGASSHQPGYPPPHINQYSYLSAAIVLAQPEAPEPDVDQLQLDALDEEINRMDPANEGYAQRMRELSKLCGTLGRLPRRYVLHNELTLYGYCPHSYGSFSDVWMGQYGGVRAAVKALRTHVGDQFAMKKAFYSEVTYWKRLNHPHIVPFLGVSSRFQLSIISKWMDNGDLMSYLDVHPETERLPLIVQIASAMEYMHSSLVVHGDIKGRNVLINSHGQACLSDFGLAVTVYHTQSMNAMRSSTGSSTSPGTIRWSAPERLMPTEDPRHTMPTMASDVYSFGIMMWEVYNRKIPFNNIRNEWLVMPQIVGGSRPPHSPQISGNVRCLMESCWSQERHHRPSSEIIAKRLQEELKYTSLRIWDSFNQAVLDVADELSATYPPYKRAVITLLATVESFRRTEGLQDAFTYATQRLATLRINFKTQRSDILHASQRKKSFLEAVVRTIQWVEKSVKIKLDRGILKHIWEHPSDISAISNALCMLGDVVGYVDHLVMTAAAPTRFPAHFMTQRQSMNELTFVETAHFLEGGSLRQCTEGTRTELLTDMMTWGAAASGLPMICLLTGPAGSGKSTVAHTICSNLHDLDLLGGSFFCSRYDDDDKRRSTKFVFSTLAHLLASYKSDFASALDQVLKSNPRAGSFGPAEQLIKLIVGPIRDFHSSQNAPVLPARVCVIDALDECTDDDKTVYDFMCLLLAQSDKLPLKFLITSRPQPRITEAFEQAETNRYIEYRVNDIPESIVRDDIRAYLSSEQEQYSVCQDTVGWPPLVQVETLARQAGTLFICASTACKYIWDVGDDVAQRLKELSTLGTHQLGGIDPMYEFVLERARGTKCETTWEITRRCLQAIARLSQPLSLGDLAAMMGVEPRSLRIALAGLQPVLHIPSSDHPAAIFVLHASFPDFLTDEKRSRGTPWFLDNTTVHTDMLRGCLTVMKTELRFNISNSRSSYVPKTEKPNKHSISAALRYSCLHWIDHLEGCGPLEDADMVVLTELMYTRFLYWLEVLSATSSVGVAPFIMARLLSWLVKEDPDASGRAKIRFSKSDSTASAFQQFAADAKAFINTFSVPIERSCPHIYLSALAATSKQSKVWSRLSKVFENVPRTNTVQSQAIRLTFTLRGHKEEVNSVAFSPDGRRIVSGSRDQTIRLWDAASGEAAGEPMRGHQDGIMCLAFSPDGKHVVSGSMDQTLRLWDSATGASVGEPLRGHDNGVVTVAFSPNGMRIVSGSSDSTLRQWDAATGAAVRVPMHGHADTVTSVAFSPDSTRIVSGSLDKTIILWDVATGVALRERLFGHKSGIFSVAFSSSGTRIVSGSSDRTIRLWNAVTGVVIGEPLCGHEMTVVSLAFSPNGTRIVSGSKDQTIRLWDAVTGAAIRGPIRGHEKAVASVAFSPDSARIVSCSEDETIRLWDTVTIFAAKDPLCSHKNAVYSVAFSPDGTRIVSGSKDQTICMWDAVTGAAIGEPLLGHNNAIMSVAFSPDGTRIVSGSSDKTMRLWDAFTGAVIGESMRGHDQAVVSVAFSPDGKRIISGSSDHKLCLWDGVTGAAVGEPMRGHAKAVASVAFSSDGMRIVSGSDDRTIRLWDAATGHVIGEPLVGHGSSVVSVAFSPDGTRVVSGSWDQTVRLWDAATGVVIGRPLRGHEGYVRSVAFSPDGTRIVSGSQDRTIRLWDEGTRQAIGAPLRGHEGYIWSVTFSPDGTRIVSGSSDHTIRLWNTLTGASPVHSHGRRAKPLALSQDSTERVAAYLQRNTDPHAEHLPSERTSYGYLHSTSVGQANQVAFSPDNAHSTCIDSLLSPGCDPRDLFTLGDDGWLRGPKDELFLWVLPEHRRGLWWPRMKAVSFGTHPVMLDLSRFFHGTNWTKCFSDDEHDEDQDGTTALNQSD